VTPRRVLMYRFFALAAAVVAALVAAADSFPCGK
jgi:hypothetical protein